MNSFGKNFRLSIFGESHGKAIGIVIDGCPPGIELSLSDFSKDLNRRKPGISGTTPRKEKDIPELISGIFKGRTTGAPITILFENNDISSEDYELIRNTPRPGHADFVAWKKYKGFNDYRGGGHFSGRLTACLVVAGIIAKKIIRPVDISANLIEAGGSVNIENAVGEALKNGDSIGGVVECIGYNIPVGLGEPFFDSVESLISHLAFSVPAIKGIEFGAGFHSAKMRGSTHNDEIIDASGKTRTNHAGGINGGITNGNELTFRVSVKPTSSISKDQNTINLKNKESDIVNVKGRHDACIALRVPVIIEAITAIALAELSIK